MMMKIISISIFILFTSLAFAQAPEKMNYQAVARDLSGLPLVSTTVDLEFEILEASATGLVTYRETQSKITNQFGLFTAEIGGGMQTSVGNFPGIAWGANTYYLRITVNGDVMPATQLLSVPYALYSKQSANGPAGLDGLNCWDINGNGVEDATEDINGDGIWDALDCQGTGSALSAGDGIDITGGVITSTSDTSLTNELQVISISNDTIFLSDGGFVKLPSAAGDNWGTDTVSYQAANITGQGTVANPLIVIDNDTSAVNELQDLSWNNTDSNIIDLTNGTSISLASNTPTANQVLTWDGDKWIAQTLTAGVWTQGMGNDIYNNTDSVGIGTTDPKSLLQIGDYTHVSPLDISATEKYSGLTHNAYWDGTGLINTTGGISGASVLGDNNGVPAYRWLLYPAQPAGTNMSLVTTDLRMSLTGKGLAINNDGASAGLDVKSIDSASILMDIPNDNSQATLSYRSPSNNILSLRVPTVLTGGDYTLTYPTTLPAANGSPLVSDLTGNLSWGTLSGSPWTKGLVGIHPTDLTDNVGIGMSNPAAKLDVLSTTANNQTVLTQILNQNNAAVDFSSLYVEAQSSGSSTEYRAAQFQSSGPGAVGSSIGIKASATGGATNWAGYFEAGNVYIQNDVGIGTITPSYPLEINRNQAGTGALLGITNPSGTGDATIHFSTGTGNFSMGRNGNTFKIAQASNLGSNVRMTIASTGNVGFGITAPTAKVHSEGFGGEALRVQNTSATVATMSVTNSSGGPAATFINGAVGIGVLVPSARLQLNGTLRLQNLGGTAPVIGSVLTAIDANGNAQWQTSAAVSSPWTQGTGITELATPGNNVGIGLSPSYKLDIAGDVNTNTIYRVDGVTFLDNKDSSTFIGATGNLNPVGIENTAVGMSAGQNLITGVSNTFVGHASGQLNVTGGQNVAVGSNSLSINQLGWANVAVGRNALSNNFTSGNTAVGFEAMQQNTSGVQNVALGYRAVQNIITGNSATGVGYLALENTTGDNNTGLGYGVGSTNITGSNNTFIGYASNTGTGLTNLTNATAIGSNAIVNTSNSLILGNNANVGIGTSSPTTKLHVNQTLSGSTPMLVVNNGHGTGDGSVRFTGGATHYTVGSDASAGMFKISNTSTGLGTNDRFVINSAGDVGIGTTVPSQKLHVVHAPTGISNAAIYGSNVAALNSGFFGAIAYDGGATNYGMFAHSDALPNTSPLGVSRANDGALVNFISGGVTEGQISVSGNTITYGAFTGVHYAISSDKNLERGMLVSLTGRNDNFHGKEDSEILYGITKTVTANDPKTMGSYLSVMDPYAKESLDNPHQVMAVGNGDLWVIDNGKNLNSGDYLISANVEGHAMLDNGDFEVSYIVARVSEPVDWSKITETINGVKHKKITVFYENFIINHKADKLEKEIEELKNDFKGIKAEIEELKKYSIIGNK